MVASALNLTREGRHIAFFFHSASGLLNAKEQMTGKQELTQADFSSRF